MTVLVYWMLFATTARWLLLTWAIVASICLFFYAESNIVYEFLLYTNAHITLLFMLCLNSFKCYIHSQQLNLEKCVLLCLWTNFRQPSFRFWWSNNEQCEIWLNYMHLAPIIPLDVSVFCQYFLSVLLFLFEFFKKHGEYVGVILLVSTMVSRSVSTIQVRSANIICLSFISKLTSQKKLVLKLMCCNLLR